MLLKLGTHVRNDGLRMHVICFRDQIQYGRLAAIFFLKHVSNSFLNVCRPNSFKLGKCHKCSFMSRDRSSRLHIHANLVNMGYPFTDWRKITKTTGAMTFHVFFFLFNYLRQLRWKEVMFSPVSVCLFVCRISQKIVVCRLGVWQGRTD